MTRDGHSFRNVDEIEFRGADFPRRFSHFYRPISTRGTSRKRNIVIRPTAADADLRPFCSLHSIHEWMNSLDSFFHWLYSV